MRETGINIITQFRQRWILYNLLRIFLISAGIFILVFFISQSVLWSTGLFIITGLGLILFLKPFKISEVSVSKHLDNSLSELEHSSWLLLNSSHETSGLAALQRMKVNDTLQQNIGNTRPPIDFKFPILFFFGCCLLGPIFQSFGLFSNFDTAKGEGNEIQKISFAPIDSTIQKSRIPKITKQEVLIDFPNYTGKASVSTSDMNIKAVEGSVLTWKVSFDTIVESVYFNQSGIIEKMEYKNGEYTKSETLSSSGFYNFKFKDVNENDYLSDLYGLESISDFAPEISVSGVDEFQTFNYFDEKIIDLSAIITDDFGVADAIILATLSSGEGESVQFREQQLNFETNVQRGSKRVSLKRKINLDELEMKPGDELYFFIQSTDLKSPKPNIARSETYFAVVKDTSSFGAGVEGTLGADLMPDYFRSQRQLIIDTEKLILEKNKITEKEFKSRSNELGFDQKALRLKYGQFMGDEDDSGIAITDEDELSSALKNSESGESEKDLLKDYTHAHDSEEHQESAGLESEEDEENPLHNYLHNHSDPEASTLFEKSIKTKMKDAMAQMWDAELYLRLYEPQNSLTYQYKALELLQEIKNSARIYVHRIGFDPPPIKEDVRLTGKLENIGNYTKQDELEEENKFASIKSAISILEKIINSEYKLTEADKNLFEDAGNELAEFAVREPTKYISALENLKWLSEGVVKSKSELISVQSRLIQSVNKENRLPGNSLNYRSELDELFLKELSTND
ncbi:hypothetical protein SAMN03097699_0501 [Flavobacteriaceae bacterium MAR_2010_188]|nr:hypothetical protein SAMN03097699_0501 [Flavobacteriaceae bacterium MAR_2010_188]